MGRDLDAGDEIPGIDDLAVEDREDLQRVNPVEPLEFGDPDVDDARRGCDEIDSTLGRPPDDQPRPGDRGRKAQSRVVLVELAGFRYENGDRVAGIGGGVVVQVVG